jgi:phenylalanyl-tRNA synthetase beta chain
MSEERSVMRTSLLPGLAASLRRAQSQQLDRFAQFELGRIYVGQAEQGLPNERYQLALMLWGERRSWYADGEPMDFYDAKAALDVIVGSLAGGVVHTQRDDALDETAPYLHPRRRARVMLDDFQLGHVGELHPEVVEAMQLIGRPVFANLDVDAVLGASAARATARAIALPRFPSASRDLAVVVDEDVEAGPVAAQLRDVGGALVEAVRVFDVYRGEPVPAGRKSLAFHIVYRDPDATLTDDAIDKVHARITQHAETRFGAAVRR